MTYMPIRLASTDRELAQAFADREAAFNLVGNVLDLKDVGKALDFAKYLRTNPVIRKGFGYSPIPNILMGIGEGVMKSNKQVYNGEREDWIRNLEFDPTKINLAQTLALDAGRVFENVGNGITWGLAGKLGGNLGSKIYDWKHKDSQ